MSQKAIKQIEGYCCKVTPEQWRELVKVADEVGLMLWARSWWPVRKNLILWHDGEHFLKDTAGFGERTLIPFDSFLSKLRGDAEPWTPKAGEMVELSDNLEDWTDPVELIGHRCGMYIAWFSPDSLVIIHRLYCRPARPRYTKAEAEKLLNCIITDT